jgi:hypothetical protein
MSYPHVNYITRTEACSTTISEYMRGDRDGARPSFERMTGREGVAANARVADTLIIALPIEMTPAQRHEAIVGFMEMIDKAASPGSRPFTTSAMMPNVQPNSDLVASCS